VRERTASIAGDALTRVNLLCTRPERPKLPTIQPIHPFGRPPSLRGASPGIRERKTSTRAHHERMRWIVGLDLRPGSEGPVRFARWLLDARRPGASRTVYVHVLEEEHLRYALRQHHLDEVTGAAREAAERLLASAGATGEIRIVQGLEADEALEEARASAGADGVVVGRAAGRQGAAIVRLGRVARRMLRRLASPVAVVPPDFRGEEVGAGPVVALSSLEDDALGACRLAATLAAELGRPLAVCHVARAEALPYLPAAAIDLEARRAAGEADLAKWLRTNGLGADLAVGLVGSPVDRALDWARGANAAFLVAGSRHLSAAARIVQASTGSALAATAPTPVLVVPATNPGLSA
jgi:nucleotide-binding universal stress UspA family protein